MKKCVVHKTNTSTPDHLKEKRQEQAKKKIIAEGLSTNWLFQGLYRPEHSPGEGVGLLLANLRMH